MVKQVYLEENFRLFSPKYLLLCFLSCLVIASKLDMFILWGFLSVSFVQILIPSLKFLEATKIIAITKTFICNLKYLNWSAPVVIRLICRNHEFTKEKNLLGPKETIMKWMHDLSKSVNKKMFKK